LVITVRKCGRWARHFRTGGRDVGSERPAAGGSNESSVVELFAEEPSPAEAVMMTELVEKLLRDLGQRDAEILTLALQGHGAAEISDRLGRPSRTVYRVLDRIKKRLEVAQAEPLSPA
jgi:DNA-directed RNA polymerase specialized sigma24 family protein